MKISFIVPGVPVAKGRARSAVTKSGRTVHYTPAKTRTYERTVAWVATGEMCGRQPLSGPLELTLRFTLPIPNSWPKWKRERALTGGIRPTGPPDLDNLSKAIKDGLNGVLWGDDSQVCVTHSEKRYGTVAQTDVCVVPIRAQGAAEARGAA